MNYLLLPLLLYTLSAGADIQIPSLATNKLLVSDKPSATPADLPPDPARLTADWWRYFDVGPAVLKTRVEQAARQLQTLMQQLPEAEQASAQVNSLRFSGNLRVYLEMRGKTAPEAPVAKPVRQSYTLKEWLDVIHQQQAVKAELQSEKEDLRRDEKQWVAGRKQLDSLMATYLALPDQAPDKLAQGLAIMATRAELAVEEAQLRQQKAALVGQEAQLEQLAKESVAAQDRLFVGDEDLQRLQKEIGAMAEALRVANEKAAQLKVSAATGKLETDEGKARALLVGQRAKHAAIKAAVADAALTRKKIEWVLVQLLVAPDNAGLDRLREDFQDSVDNIDMLKDSVAVWREEAERDQERAGKALAALFAATTKQSNEVINRTQQRLTEAQNSLLTLQGLEAELLDAGLIAGRVKALISDQRGTLKTGLESVKTSSVKVFELVWARLGASLFKIGETPVTTLGILRVVLIATLAFVLSHFVRRGLAHLVERQRGSSAFLYTLGRLTHYLILIIGFSIGLSSIGVDLSNFALIAGALSLGIGFGLQAIVSNFVSGLIVLFERSLRIGDFVELSSGLAGEVRAINVRSTLVTTTDMVEILVPNSEFVNGQVINWTLTDASRRIHIPFGVAYGSDKEVVRQAALEAAHNTPHTLKSKHGREPEVWLTNFGDSSLDFELVVWVLPQSVKRPQKVRAAYYWELETALRKYGIEIPFPQRDVHIRSGFHNAPSLPPETLD